MIGDPNNIKKMSAIYVAMREVKEIDRSNYFNNYYSEVIGRINDHAIRHYKIKYDENRSLEDQEHIANTYLESINSK